MKKFALLAILAISISAASAADVGVTVGRNSAKQQVYTLSAGTQLYGFDAVAAASTTSKLGVAKTDTVSLTAGKSIGFGSFSVGAFAGPEFVRTEAKSGYGLKYGVGASYALTPTLALVADAHRFSGRTNIQSANSNVVSAGLVYKF
jgi:opacity protein-like surface antigen